jgi:predicted DNA-binding transcriptional regulator AlpA
LTPVPLLTVADLARLLGLTPRGIYNRRHRRGALPPATPLGRTLRWRADDVERWLAAQSESHPV